MKDKSTKPLCLAPVHSPLTRRGFIKGSATLLGVSLMGTLAGGGGIHCTTKELPA